MKPDRLEAWEMTEAYLDLRSEYGNAQEAIASLETWMI